MVNPRILFGLKTAKFDSDGVLTGTGFVQPKTVTTSVTLPTVPAPKRLRSEPVNTLPAAFVAELEATVAAEKAVW